MKSEKISGKDLINVGIYAALYCLLMTVTSFIGFVPILMPFIGIVAPLVCATPLMLFITKTNKFGPLTIFGILVGGVLWITGMGYWPFIFAVILAPIADFICKSGDYKSVKKTILASGFFHAIFFGCMVPLYLDTESYFAVRPDFGAEYAAQVMAIVQPWTAPVLLLGGFIAGCVGAWIGIKLLKKHFLKAGIA